MRRILTMAMMAGLLAGGTWAQWGRGFGRAAVAGPTTAPYERRLEFLATYLNLSEGQKTQFKAALDALHTKTQTVLQSIEQTQLKLREAVRSNAPAATIQPLAEALGKLHAELIAARAQTMVTLRGLLTQEQRDKLDKLCPQGCGLGLGPGFGLGGGMRHGWRL